MRPDGTQVITIGSDFRVIVSPSPLCVPDSLSKDIDAIWQTAIEQPGSKLFDGKILCATDVSPSVITCSVIPYRFFYAQRQSNIIQDSLQIRAVAVSGLILHNQLVYFGRRSMVTTQYPGFIELVPSGSLDADLVVSNGAADFRLQLTEELVEEVGINHSSVASINPLFLILDDQENTWDICCRITLLPNATISTGDNVHSKEYKEILSVPVSQATSFLDANSGNLVPTSLTILQEFSPRFS